MKRTGCATVCILIGASLFAQVTKLPFSDPAAPPFIVRLQRIQSDKNVCAIVRGDGLFHLESEDTNRVEVSEGALDDRDLTELTAMLNNNELAALTQQKIASPLLMLEKDEFLVSVLRSAVTQNLTFMDRESRRPFDSFINPLVHWLDALQRHPHTSLSEFEGRNNCLPPKKLEFSTRPEIRIPVEAPSASANAEKNSSPSVGPAAAPTRSQTNQFLVRWRVNHIVQGNVEDTCIIVYPSGHYRMERSSQSYGEKLKFRAFEDMLNEEQLQQLENLLNEPGLKSSTHRNLPQGKLFREGELTALDVPRDGGVQELSFANYFGVPGWVSNVSSGTDPEERIVAPLRKWLKTHIEAKKSSPVQGAVSTHCVPQPAAGVNHP